MPPKTNEEYMREIRNIQPAHPLVYERIEQILTEKDKQKEEAVAEARRECHKLSIGKVVNECEEMEELYKKDRLPRIALEDLKFRIIRRVTFEALTPPTN